MDNFAIVLFFKKHIIKTMKQKTKIFIAIFFLVFVFSALNVFETQAGTGESGRGWLWEGSEDCDIDQNGFEDALCGGDNISTPIGTIMVW